MSDSSRRVYSWGMASSIYNMYSQIPKGILGKLMACKHSALVYNALVSGFLASVIICQYPSCSASWWRFVFRKELLSQHSMSSSLSCNDWYMYIYMYSADEATSVSFAGYGLLACLDSFHRISAHFERMAASYDPAAFSITKDLLPELPGLLEMNQSFVCWSLFLLKSGLADALNSTGKFPQTSLLPIVCKCYPISQTKQSFV